MARSPHRSWTDLYLLDWQTSIAGQEIGPPGVSWLCDFKRPVPIQGAGYQRQRDALPRAVARRRVRPLNLCKLLVRDASKGAQCLPNLQHRLPESLGNPGVQMHPQCVEESVR